MSHAAQLAQLEVFVAVVDAGSFTGAAKALAASKSYVSKQIAALEERLGAPLLHRTTRQLRLTDVGQLLHTRGAKALDEIRLAELAVSEHSDSPRGKLRVSLPLTMGVRYLLPAIVSFAAQYDDVELDLDLSDGLVDLISDGFDAAIRIGNLDDSSHIARRLASSTVMCVASPAYLDKHGTPPDAAALTKHSCLQYRFMDSFAAWPMPLGGPKATELEGRVASNNGDALCAAAVAGLGIVLLPDFIARPDVEAGKLVQILTQELSREIGVWIVFPPTRHMTAKVRAFADHMIEQFQTPPWACPA